MQGINSKEQVVNEKVMVLPFLGSIKAHFYIE
jgi:hypothetical protein